MIEAIFFDMGGVLMDLHLDRCIEAYRNIAGFSNIDEFIDPWHQRGFLKDLERGDIDFEGYMTECKRHCFRSTSTQTILRCHSEFFSAPSPDTVALIKELKERYDLYVLSNNNCVSMSIVRPLFDSAGLNFEENFRKLFLSFEMRLLKPDPEIFRQAISQSGHQPGSILFVDDSLSNVQGGAAAGMKSVLHTQGTSLKQLIYDNL